ncbi:MAG: MMPL family transporter [Xanthobacteraceae bacterium]
MGAPLTLAAGAAAAGFLSFMPTSYKGLAELGLIAGCGMVIAYATSMTLLPALLRAVNPPPEPRVMRRSPPPTVSCSGTASRWWPSPPAWRLPVYRCWSICASNSTRSSCEILIPSRWRPTSN